MSSSSTDSRLLDADEPSPVLVERLDGDSPVFLVCDHAGARIPRKLQELGLSEVDRFRHIAWDIGALGVAQAISAEMDAALISQVYSRLVIDCNRPLVSEQSIAILSELTDIPGNVSLTDADRAARQTMIFAPYHAAVSEALDARAKKKQPTVLVSVHSFTPVYKGDVRTMHAAVLYHQKKELAVPMLEAMRAHSDLVIGDNEPYAASLTTDYAIPVHGEQRGLPHVGLEIRQDLIATPASQRIWGKRIADALRTSLAKIFPDSSAS